jgi:hypothetical protein
MIYTYDYNFVIMLVSSKYGLRNVSEKSIEINVLNELASFLWSRYKLTTTVISPTQVEEKNLCFDDIIEGLPSGLVLAIQFKRPYAMRRPRHVVKFTALTRQLSRLSNIFLPNEAFLFLTPLTTNNSLVSHRLGLLKITVALGVHLIPNVRKTSQTTRTIRVYPPTGGSRIPQVKVSDPRRFEEAKNVVTVAQLAKNISNSEAGHRISQDREARERGERIGVRHVYYLHVSRFGYPKHKW